MGDVIYLPAQQTIGSFSTIPDNVTFSSAFVAQLELVVYTDTDFCHVHTFQKPKQLFRDIWADDTSRVRLIEAVSVPPYAMLSRTICSYADCIPSWTRKVWKSSSFIVISSKSLHFLFSTLVQVEPTMHVLSVFVAFCVILEC